MGAVTRPSGHDEPLMRFATAAAVGCGLWALVAGELLSLPGAVVAASAYAGALAAHNLRLGLRRLLSPGAVLCGLAATPSAPDLGHICGVLVAAVAVGHALSTDSARDRRVALAPPALMLVLAGGVAPGPPIAAPFVGGWLCLLVAAVGAHSVSGSSGPRGRLPVTRYATAVILAFVLSLLAFLVLPHPDSTPRHNRLRDAMTRAGAAPQQTRSETSYLGDRLDMRIRGTLPDTPIVSVPVDSARLWRGGVLDAYDGVTWRDTSASSVTRGAIGRRVEGGIFAIDAASSLSTSRSDQVLALQGGATPLVSPGVVQEVVTDGLLFVSGATGVVLPGSRRSRAAYVVTSAAVPAGAEQADRPTAGGNAGVGMAGSDRDRWVQLPPLVTFRTRELARRLTSGASSTQVAIEAVHDYVQSSEVYDLDSPVPRPGVDAVDDFLFVSKRGFCEQFAAAAVVLLRSVGIPARMATGFSNGVDQGGRRVLRASDAHAWVEAFVPGSGWVTSDPTGSSDSSARGSGHRLDPLRRALATSHGRLLLAALVVLLAGVGSLTAWAIVRWWRSRRRRQRPEPPPLLAAYERFDAALGRRGLARAGSESLHELRTRVGHRGDVGQALETLERELYAGLPSVSDQQRAAAVAQFDRCAAAMTEGD